MKQKIIYPLLLGALAFFFTTPYNMSGSVWLSTLAVIIHYCLYGIALQKKWQYTPLQMLMFWVAQPLVSLASIPFDTDTTHLQQASPYLFPIIVPTFSLLAAMSLYLGYAWFSIEKNKKQLILLSTAYLVSLIFLWKEIMPYMIFRQNTFVTNEKIAEDSFAFSPQNTNYLLCWEPVSWADERELAAFQTFYQLHKNDPNTHIALMICHSGQSMAQAEIDRRLAAYTFPKYEDKQAKWLKFPQKYRKSVMLVIDKKGQIQYEVLHDPHNQGGQWYEFITSL